MQSTPVKVHYNTIQYITIQYNTIQYNTIQYNTIQYDTIQYKLFPCVCEVGTVDKISDYQPEGPGFNPWPGRGLNFGRPSFATPSVDWDVKPLVKSLAVLSGDLKELTHLSIRVGECRCCGQCPRLMRTEWPC